MWRGTVTTGVFILLFQFQNISGWRSFGFNFLNTSAVAYSNKLDVNMTINKNNRLNIYFAINEEILDPIVKMEIFLQSPDTGRYNMEIMNRTIDSCKFFTNKVYEPLIQLVYQILLDQGDLPTSCPLKVKSYAIENMTIDPDRLPPYIPERKGYVKMIFSTKKSDPKPLVMTSVYFEIKNAALNRFKTTN